MRIEFKEKGGRGGGGSVTMARKVDGKFAAAIKEKTC